MTIQKIINYITHTPENTNPNVLKDMLKQISGSSDSDDIYQKFIDNMIFIPVHKTTIPAEEIYGEDWYIYTIDYSIEELLAQYNNKMCCVYFTDPILTQNQVYWTILSDYESGENEGSLYFYGGIANDYSYEFSLIYDPGDYGWAEDFSISANSVFVSLYTPL